MYEIQTINCLKLFCDENMDDEVFILYIHSKGVRNAGNKLVTESWRKMMQYFLIEKWMSCIDNLSIYNTLGNNVVNMNSENFEEVSINNSHTIHYSGNFWWSKKSYVKTLPYINIDLSKNLFNYRFKAENWILSNYNKSNKNEKFGIIFQDDTNTHPYHRYIFDFYKEMDFIVKDLTI